MTWFFAILVVALIGGIVVVASGRGEGLPPAQEDVTPDGLPEDGRIGPEDLDRVRFRTSVGGYRKAEVDELLRRLRQQLERD
jgi:DivIVA domain-containing protein